MKKSTKYITGQYGITETRIVDQLGAGEAQRVDSQRLGDLQQGKYMPKLAG